MEIIPGHIIDAILDELGDSEQVVEQHISLFAEKQPALMGYLISDDFDILNEDEQSFLLFLGLTIWLAVERFAPGQPEVSDEKVSEMEEHNWEMMNNMQKVPFEDRLDAFYDDTPQEELLAFIEDALLPDEDEEDDDELEVISKEGMEPVFVALKTVLDSLTK